MGGVLNLAWCRTDDLDEVMKTVTSPAPKEAEVEARAPSPYPRSVRSRATSFTSSLSARIDDTALPALQTKGVGDEGCAGAATRRGDRARELRSRRARPRR